MICISRSVISLQLFSFAQLTQPCKTSFRNGLGTLTNILSASSVNFTSVCNLSAAYLTLDKSTSLSGIPIAIGFSKSLHQKYLESLDGNLNYVAVTTEENAGDTANPDAESGATGEEGQVTQKIWETFEKDPNTGNYIDPETGHQIDPDTGDDLDGVETGQPQGESTESPAE